MRGPKRRGFPRPILGATLGTIVLLAFTGCPGPPAPPSEDLTTATAATADTADMFEYSLEASIETRSPDGTKTRSTTRSQGSARNHEGYLQAVSTDPAPAGADSPLVLSEFPGGVRKPAEPYWYSGRSGSMDAFGELAEVLPPLGRPQTVTSRFDGFAAAASGAETITNLGVMEVRGHSVDAYTFPIAEKPLTGAPPFASPTPSVTATATASGSPGTSPSSPPSPRPSTPADATTLVLARVAGIPTPLIGSSTGVMAATAAGWVDQINGRLRRISTRLEASRYGAAITVESTMDLWGFDPSGNYKEPIDTTLVSPNQQALIRTSQFPIVAPYSVPAGIQFVGIHPPTEQVACPTVLLDLTGRGRDGYVEVSQTSVECVSARTPPGPLSVTETATGEKVTYVRTGDEITLFRTIGTTSVHMTAKQGVSFAEAIRMSTTLRPMVVPIPPELAMPISVEGPERR